MNVITAEAEHVLLAENLVFIESRDYKTWAKWHKEGKTKWELGNGVIAERSKDTLVWYLWKTYPDQARTFLKVVPTDMPEHIYRTLLEAQPWVCI